MPGAFVSNEAGLSKLGAGRLEFLERRMELLGSFDSEDDEPGILEEDFVARMKTLSLVCRQPEKKRRSVIFLDPEGWLRSDPLPWK